MPKLVNKPLKYNNIKVYYDLNNDCVIDPKLSLIKPNNNLVIFDSRLEYNTYCAIRSVVKKERILIHKPIPIWDKSERFPKFDWCVDFTVSLSSGTELYVEAKGICTDDFNYRLRAIDKFQPHLIDRMIFVTQITKKIIGTNSNRVFSTLLPELPNKLMQMIKSYEK